MQAQPGPAGGATAAMPVAVCQVCSSACDALSHDASLCPLTLLMSSPSVSAFTSSPPPVIPPAGCWGCDPGDDQNRVLAAPPGRTRASCACRPPCVWGCALSPRRSNPIRSTCHTAHNTCTQGSSHTEEGQEENQRTFWPRQKEQAQAEEGEASKQFSEAERKRGRGLREQGAACEEHCDHRGRQGSRDREGMGWHDTT